MTYKVDLHVHSWLSDDSDADPEELIHKAIELGLHGIAFTEHHSYEVSEPIEDLRERYKEKIMVFRGVEFSATEGHCLIFGVNSDKLFPKHASVTEIVQTVNIHQGVVIPSHPYRGMNSLGDSIKRIKGIHAIEGFNGNNQHSSNMKALQTAAALHLPHTGGSDAHAPREVGSCYTEFFDRVTNDSFIDLLRAGNYRGVDIRKISKGLIS